jgi:hypothetical protein
MFCNAVAAKCPKEESECSCPSPILLNAVRKLEIRRHLTTLTVQIWLVLELEHFVDFISLSALKR